MVNFTEDEHNALTHFGIRRKSGRYPWGSGNDPYQRSVGFRSFMDDLKKDNPNITDAQVAKVLTEYVNRGIPEGSPDYKKVSSFDVRAGITSSTAQIRAENQARAYHLVKEKGYSNRKAAEIMGLGSGPSAESTVRGWLKHADTINEKSVEATATKLKEELDSKPYLDVGKGSHLHMGITSTKLNTAVAFLQDEGYNVHLIRQPQPGSEKMTQFKILTKENVDWHETQQAVRRGEIYNVHAQSDDGGLNYTSPKELPVYVSSKRIHVRYGDEGGTAMDGVIQLRRGVEDLDLGSSRYAQVRVAVDGSHYLKGMAMYADDLPAGVDMRFNTNKSNTGNKLDAMKPLNTKPDGSVDNASPFGATVNPRTYTDKKGKTQTSPLNLVYEEGDWAKWSRSLSSQMLSKQPSSLANRQLMIARKQAEDELKAINSLTNPVVKKKLLDEYADSADAAAVHLKAAALPRQSTRVILPINTIRPNEVYAPGYENGDKLALVRHPHGGPFEIPVLSVNNKNLTAKRALQDAEDAIGIHHSVASQLSGADFDGDTVVVVPAEGITHHKAIPDLATFDPKSAYPKYDGMPTMTKKNTQTEMGKISNLITDMTIRGADQNEIARAIKHSMVVIDAEKHELNYKQSAIDRGISDLKDRYQGGKNKGAATLISKAGKEKKIPQVKQPYGKAGINPKTGEKILEPTGRTYTRPGVTEIDPITGITKPKVFTKMTKGTEMEFTKDAHTLISADATPIEQVYATHANSMKSLANQARKESVSLTMPKISPAAKAHYAKEVASLDTKLKTALQNAPLERRALALGAAMARQRIDDNPQWDNEEIRRAKFQARDDARLMTGAKKVLVDIDDNEWNAIQSGAIGHTVLSSILTNSDMKRVRELATPRVRTSLTPGQMARAKALASQGRSVSSIAETLGIPRSTLSDNLKE